jgi:alpha-tubulin suppressor-like RCC1 family protein
MLINLVVLTHILIKNKACAHQQMEKKKKKHKTNKKQKKKTKIQTKQIANPTKKLIY